MSEFKVNQVWLTRGGDKARIIETNRTGMFPIEAMRLANGAIGKYAADGKWDRQCQTALDLVRLIEDMPAAEAQVDYQPESAVLLEGQQVPVPEIDGDDTPIFTLSMGDNYVWPEDSPKGCCGGCAKTRIAGANADLAEAQLAAFLNQPPGKVLLAEGYDRLADVLHRAFQQAASGKGKERHASAGVAFEGQPMSTINELLGSVDGYLYQAMKKATESRRLPAGRDVAELLGAINYLAGAVLQLERTRVKS